MNTNPQTTPQAETPPNQEICPHQGQRRLEEPNPNDRSGTGGVALVYCAQCGALLPNEC